MVRKLETNCAFKLLILEEREEIEMHRIWGKQEEIQNLWHRCSLKLNRQIKEEEGCCKYLDTGDKREGSYYMPLYLHTLSIWLQLQLQRSAEGVLYLTQPQAQFVSLDRPWLGQPNILRLSLENKLCSKTKKCSFVATKCSFTPRPPPSRCANLDIKNQTTTDQHSCQYFHVTVRMLAIAGVTFFGKLFA